MKRTILAGLGLALAFGLTAQAQDMPQQAPDPAANPPAANPMPAAPGFKAGMAVKDGSGSLVGKVAKTGPGPNSETVDVVIDMKTVKVPATALALSPDGGSAISTMSKSAILAAAGKARK